jgi:hypothetical protein
VFVFGEYGGSLQGPSFPLANAAATLSLDANRLAHATFPQRTSLARFAAHSPRFLHPLMNDTDGLFTRPS